MAGIVMETRDERKQVVLAAVEGLLDHLEEDFDEDAEIGSVIICAELRQLDEDGESTIPTFFSLNENPIWRRGMFEILADYHRVNVGGD